VSYIKYGISDLALLQIKFRLLFEAFFSYIRDLYFGGTFSQRVIWSGNSLPWHVVQATFFNWSRD